MLGYACIVMQKDADSYELHRRHLVYLVYSDTYLQANLMMVAVNLAYVVRDLC